MSLNKKFDTGTSHYVEIDYVVAGSDIAAGELRTVGDITGYAFEAGVIGATVALVVQSAKTRAKKITGAMAIGKKLYWDPTGNPLGGTAGTGALTTVLTAALKCVGVVAMAAGASATEVVMIFDGIKPALTELTDYDNTTLPTNGQIPKYVTGTLKWTPSTDA